MLHRSPARAVLLLEARPLLIEQLDALTQGQGTRDFRLLGLGVWGFVGLFEQLDALTQGGCRCRGPYGVEGVGV